MADFVYSDLLPLGPQETPYRLLTTDGVDTFEAAGETFLRVHPDALTRLAYEGMHDIAHYLRPGHLQQLRNILDDPEASPNDRFVALDLLKNANISAGGVLPMCQDTGTAIVMGKKGERVITGGGDGEALSKGVFDAYTRLNLRYSQMAPLTTWDEKNTGTNLPAQIDLYATDGDEYHFLLMAKGGGSANKSFLFQETKAILNPDAMRRFLDEKLRSLGTAACPPYHLAVVIGGTSAEAALKTAKLASARYLDTLPTEGTLAGHGIRDTALEAEILELTREFGIGAQFGGKYFCHDVRVVRLPRHGASLPVAIAVSCSADRQVKGKITAEGVFLEQLETDPAHYMPEVTDEHLDDDVVRIDLNRPMSEDPRRAQPLPGQDAAVTVRSRRRRARHRARQDQGHAGRGRADARLPARPRRLLRRAGQDARGIRLWLVRPDDRRTHGLLRRPVPEGRWLLRDARQGQPFGAGDEGLSRERRLLPRVDRRTGRPPGPGRHQEGRRPGVPRARHGSGVEDRGRGLPRLHRRRRQGQ